MRALVTGIAGFAGSHLAEYCLARSDVEVWGLVRNRSQLGAAAALASRVRMVQADLRDASAVDAAVAEAEPDLVFHLAGQPSVPLSFEDPAGTLLDNAVGQLNLIRAVLLHRPRARFLVVGSGTEYGVIQPRDNPIHEGVPLRPNDPYAVSKVTQDLFGFQYFSSHQLQAIRVRPFNHIGPRQSAEFVASGFAKQVAEIEAGTIAPELRVGNLTAERDFTDVRDMVRAYFLAATEGEAGEVYNLGSGRGRRIADILGMLAAYSRVHLAVKEDPSRFRPVDTPSFVCDASKFRARTGWEPQIPLEKTLLDLLNYWRGKQVAAAPLLT